MLCRYWKSNRASHESNSADFLLVNDDTIIVVIVATRWMIWVRFSAAGGSSFRFKDVKKVLHNLTSLSDMKLAKVTSFQDGGRKLHAQIKLLFWKLDLPYCL